MRINLIPSRYYRLEIDPFCSASLYFRGSLDLSEVEKYRSSIYQKVIGNLLDVKILTNIKISDTKIQGFGDFSGKEYIFHIKEF